MSNSFTLSDDDCQKQSAVMACWRGAGGLSHSKRLQQPCDYRSQWKISAKFIHWSPRHSFTLFAAARSRCCLSGSPPPQVCFSLLENGVCAHIFLHNWPFSVVSHCSPSILCRWIVTQCYAAAECHSEKMEMDSLIAAVSLHPPCIWGLVYHLNQLSLPFSSVESQNDTSHRFPSV